MSPFAWQSNKAFLFYVTPNSVSEIYLALMQGGRVFSISSMIILFSTVSPKNSCLLWLTVSAAEQRPLMWMCKGKCVCAGLAQMKKPSVDCTSKERCCDSVKKFHFKLDTWSDTFRIHVWLYFLQVSFLKPERPNIPLSIIIYLFFCLNNAWLPRNWHDRYAINTSSNHLLFSGSIFSLTLLLLLWKSLKYMPYCAFICLEYV